MRALSLWQPWASLLLHPNPTFRKRYETRGWACPPALIGKDLAIHATARLMPDAREIVEDEEFADETFFADAFTAADWTLDTLPLGAVLGIVRVVECLRTERLNPTTQEAAFGNYEPGRFAWRMEVVEIFETPIPAKGMQGIWNWEWPTPAGIEILRHALGASHVGTELGWRNYFCASLDDPKDGMLCAQLAATDHMRAGQTINEGRERYYICTGKGIAAAKAGVA